MTPWQLKMRQARGLATIDLILRHARLVNVLSAEIYETDIGIHEGCFVGTGEYHAAERTIDLAGQYVVPGLIDGHVHIESSLLCPEEFCSLLLTHGVTTALVDPHEIANVTGMEGIYYILAALAKLPFNGFVALPSCVPATDLETAGARLTAQDLGTLAGHPGVHGLGEVMDYPGVLAGKEDLVRKLQLPLQLRDGHAPGIQAQDLNAYYLAGITTEHECSTVEEARERLRRGFYLMLREGSAAKNLLDLLPVITSLNANRCLLVTDDRNPLDLLQEGSIDHLIRLAVRAGVSPLQAVQMATINPARALGLEHLGAIAPGYQADCVVLSDLEHFVIEDVFWRGKSRREPVVSDSASDSKRGVERDSKRPGKVLTDTVHLGEWSRKQLEVRCPGGKGGEDGTTGNQNRDKQRKDNHDNHDRDDQGEGRETILARVIGVRPHSLVTDVLTLALPVYAGRVLPDNSQDVAKIAVLERHQASGRCAVGFVQGLGLRRGAVASTVAHDSHNLVVAGMNDEDMELAIRTVQGSQGGLCLTADGQVLGHLPLPIAGLMSLEPVGKVAAVLARMQQKARELGMGETVDPFMTLAFLSLPVIPHLKLTDRGLVNADRLGFVSLFPAE